MPDAGDALGDVLGAAALVAAVHHAGQRHLAARDNNVDAGRVDIGVVGQAVVDVLADAVVRAGVALRAAAAMVVLAAALGATVAEPGRDLVGRLVHEAALVAALVARRPPVIVPAGTEGARARARAVISEGIVAPISAA